MTVDQAARARAMESAKKVSERLARNHPGKYDDIEVMRDHASMTFAILCICQEYRSGGSCTCDHGPGDYDPNSRHAKARCRWTCVCDRGDE
jgi:hypothetical protein